MTLDNNSKPNKETKKTMVEIATEIKGKESSIAFLVASPLSFLYDFKGKCLK